MKDDKGLMPFNPMILKLLEGGGLKSPSQDREFTTSDSNLTLWWNKKKSSNLAEIEKGRLAAVSARAQGLREMINIMADIALAGERFYHERYRMEHERKMYDLAERMQEAQITKVERETMLIELKIQTGMEDFNFQKLENELKSLSIKKRIDSGDY
jgi:hypothetical protein